MLIGSDTRGQNIVHLLLWLLRQPGENTVMAAVSSRRGCVVLGYAVAITMAAALSQERIYTWAVSTAPRVSFQTLSSHLAYSGFSEQCRQCEQENN